MLPRRWACRRTRSVGSATARPQMLEHRQHHDVTRFSPVLPSAAQYVAKMLPRSPIRAPGSGSEIAGKPTIAVRETGLEPAHPCGHQDLNLACLPFPPLARRATVRRAADRRYRSVGATGDRPWRASSTSAPGRCRARRGGPVAGRGAGLQLTRERACRSPSCLTRPRSSAGAALSAPRSGASGTAEDRSAGAPSVARPRR
jgi:hypothetical protein